MKLLQGAVPDMISREAALQAVTLEGEFPGPLPDSLRAMLFTLGIEEALRETVRLTKENIFQRIRCIEAAPLVDRAPQIPRRSRAAGIDESDFLDATFEDGDK